MWTHMGLLAACKQNFLNLTTFDLTLILSKGSDTSILENGN
jgi:hypothetical protein